jgi:hypothetical protein
MVQDLFKPALLLAIGALAYFIRSQLSDLKDSIKSLEDSINGTPTTPSKFVLRSDCLHHINDCEGRMKERKGDCAHAMTALREVTSDLVGCVNKWIEACEVKNK